MIHKACMPVYMNSGKIVADGTGGKFEGSTRGPRGPKKGGNLRTEKRYFEQSQNGTSRLGRTEEVLTGKNRWDEK